MKIIVIDDFIDAETCNAILAKAAFAERHGTSSRSSQGLALLLPADGILAEVREKVHRAASITSAIPAPLRFYRYSEGHSYPLHADDWTVQVAASILYLNSTPEGGETHFPFAQPPLIVAPKTGRLAIWFTRCADGSLDQTSAHESLPVIRGTKEVLIDFIVTGTRC
jgi:hypothetical protein